MKYIDAEKLLAEIDRQEVGCNTDEKHTVEYNTCRKILDIITTLQQEQLTIKGWVARDDDLNHIHLFHNKPLRSKWTWACGYPSLQLPDDFMPELTWKDEPIEVELTISKLGKKAK